MALALGAPAAAERNFARACQGNPRAANAWFLRGYIVWRQQDVRQAAAMLTAAREARGKGLETGGSALEGDVKRRMYSEAGFLNVYEQPWHDIEGPARAQNHMHQYLQNLPR